MSRVNPERYSLAEPRISFYMIEIVLVLSLIVLVIKQQKIMAPHYADDNIMKIIVNNIFLTSLQTCNCTVSHKYLLASMHSATQSD